jgi:hypothetical protein
VRELFPASEASWRTPTLLLFSGGMAAGGWSPACSTTISDIMRRVAVGIGANILNLLIVSVLVGRKRQPAV